MKRFLTLFALCAFFACADPETGGTGDNPLFPESNEELPVSVEQALSTLHDMMSVLYGGTRSGGRTVSSVEIYKPGEASGTAETRANPGQNQGGGLLDDPGMTLAPAYYVIGFAEGGYSVMSATDESGFMVCITEAGTLTVEEMQEIEFRLANPAPLPADSLRWISYEDIHNFGFGEEGNPEPFDIADYCDDPDPGDEPYEDLGEYIAEPAGSDDFVKELLVDYLMEGRTINYGPDGLILPYGAGHFIEWVEPPQDQVEELPEGWHLWPGNGSSSYYYEYGDWTFSDDKIGPLLTTKWHQDDPFNKYCHSYYHVSGGGVLHYPAGCVAIALAQIVAFNEKPTTPFFYSDITSTWVALKGHDYKKSTTNQVELRMRDDLARMVYRIGLGVDMDYDVSGSSATDAAAKKYLKKKLGYRDVGKKSKNIESHINGMINRGIPVYISGQRSGKKGHAWLIDGSANQTRKVRVINPRKGTLRSTGTETRFLLHCNFGWGGRADGYYFYGVFDTKNPVDFESNTDPGSAGSYHYDRSLTVIKYSI